MEIKEANEKSPATKKPIMTEKSKIYLERRRKVEQGFLDKKVEKSFFKLENGAKVRVLASFMDVPKELKKERNLNEPIRISVYVPGLFETKPANFGNHPLETKLVGSLLLGNVDTIFMIKAEGLNKQAFKNDKEGVVQKIVSECSFSVLKKKLNKMYPEEKFNFRVVGYSEGATQAASLAAIISESDLGEVKEFVSVGGAGMVGVEKQENARPVFFIKEGLTEKENVENSVLGNKVFLKEGRDTYFLAGEVIGNKKTGGLEGALGRTKTDLLADINNVGKWGFRFLASGIIGGKIEEVPYERLRAAITMNPDYDKLARNGIPIIVFSGTEDVIFPNKKVREKVKELRKIGGKVVLISVSQADHSFAHINPSGVAYAIEIAKEKSGL